MFWATAVIALSSCNESQVADSQSGERTGDAPYIETGDLPQIRKHKKLRLLLPQTLEIGDLPRVGRADRVFEEMAHAFAREMQLEPLPIYVAARADLIPFLLEGKGDVIVANLTVTPDRKKRVAFTAPVTIIHEQVVTRADDDRLTKAADLAGRRVALRKSSSFWPQVQALKKRYPTVALEVVPENIDTEAILLRVASGKYDVTVAHSNLVEQVLAYRRELKVAFDLSRNRLISWAVRPKATKLRAALDQFLATTNTAQPRSTVYHEDLPGLKERQILRVLTRNNPATYFVWRGELMGFEYDLIRKFAEEQGLTVEMIVPPTWGDLIPWLKQGRGDVIAASMTITKERTKQGIFFSTPYNYVQEMLVARKKDTVGSVQDLNGRTIVVSPNASYWQTLQTMKRMGGTFILEAAPDHLTTSEIIDKVARGEYDLTVGDSHLLALELTWRADIKGAFALTAAVPHGWAVLSSKPKLVKAINAFIKKTYRGEFYNLTYQKYFKSPRTIRRHVKNEAKKTGQLSPFDQHVREYARRYGFDWRLITAQMFEESRFDPDARSWAGARGLLQVMPRTGSELSLTNLTDPATGIHAGVKYLAWLRDRFETEVPEIERTWFSLAAYNAGWGHVWDARELARQIGLNNNRWFDHVERAMLLLSRPKYYERARHGFVRGGQPVEYVQKIKSRYEAYTRVTGL
ncbi:MAG: transporter substrate-binding domain-containing protein [Burkholderiales bacterium]|nr:transporter substrate-binding domain-containing protein [Burkholderiales bacterium]